MTEPERRDPLSVSTGDIVIFNEQLLRVETLYTLIYLNDYFEDDETHTHAFTIDKDDKTITRGYSYADSKEEKRALCVKYIETAQVLKTDTTREELLAIHKACLQERIQQFHAAESSVDAARAREATARATLRKHISRCLAGV